MIASPICGALAAAYLTLPVVHYFRATGLPIPATDNDTTTLAAALSHWRFPHVDFGYLVRDGHWEDQAGGVNGWNVGGFRRATLQRDAED
jgi:hypothetical protein